MKRNKLKLSFSKAQDGFTLIELLVTIAIIGILTSVLMVNFIGVRQRARDAQRKTNIKQIQAAFEVYRSDKAQYPCFSGGCGPAYANTLNTMMTTLAGYLSDDVTDPLYPPGCPNYLVASSGSNYTIFAQLENANDVDGAADKTPPVVNAGTVTTCTGGSGGKCKNYTSNVCTNKVYNYWVNNP